MNTDDSFAQPISHKAMRYSLRPAREDDFEFVFALNKKNMRKYVDTLRGWDDDAERADMREKFRPGLDQIIVLHDRDIGCLSVTRRSDCVHLRHIEIAPDAQGRGIGTAVLQDILKSARQAHLPTELMVLEDNPAKRLYERLGFKVVRTVDFGDRGRKCLMQAPA